MCGILCADQKYLFKCFRTFPYIARAAACPVPWSSSRTSRLQFWKGAAFVNGLLPSVEIGLEIRTAWHTQEHLRYIAP